MKRRMEKYRNDRIESDRWRKNGSKLNFGKQEKNRLDDHSLCSASLHAYVPAEQIIYYPSTFTIARRVNH